MSRWDLTGLFWDDYVAPKVKKVKEKRTPPDPFWLRGDYLPQLEEARAYRFDIMTPREILAAQAAGERFVYDFELYPNYALLGFKHIASGKIVKFELHDGERLTGDALEQFRWMMTNLVLIGFNSISFDTPIAVAACAGYDTYALAQAADLLINGGEFGNGLRPYEFYRLKKLKAFYVDQIDLIELTPLGPGLKICAGRYHAHRMADLPFKPGSLLSIEQKDILRWYWTNDLDNTLGLYEIHGEAIHLRELLTREYGVDVRSKSDPQIAEEVIKTEIKRMTGQKWLNKATIEPGRQFKYRAPSYIKYRSETMQWVLDFVQRQDFTIGNTGKPVETEALSKLTFRIGETDYKVGIGGLHSKEKKAIHFTDEDYELTDNDVTSYYPSLIIQQGMYPPNIGPAFLQVFKRIYDRRIAAKRAGDKGTAETLKIVLNGTFGKTGEQGGRSVVYYPEMMIQVTMTGQLSLLMLIEMLELEGIQVVSANTDGIVIKCPRALIERKAEILKEWEVATGLGLESTPYKAIFSRDVNNYIALLDEPDAKKKDGFKYAKSIGEYRKITDAYPLKWNPTCEICSEAIIVFLATGTPVEATIRACTDVRKFIEVRRVSGGAVKGDTYLGKAVRWYYAEGEEGAIINASNGYDVPKSQGAKPCMTMPEAIPADLNYQYYVERALRMLEKDFTPKGEAGLGGEDEDEDDEDEKEQASAD